MGNNYQASLGASISPAGIRQVENQIKAISKKYKLNLELNTSSIANTTKKIQQQLNKTKMQLRIDDAVGITQNEDKKARDYLKIWNKAERDLAITREKEDVKSYLLKSQRQIKLVAEREKLEKAQLASQLKNAEKLESFMSRQSNALKRSVAGKDALLEKSGLNTEYQSIINDLSKMSSSGGKSIKEMSTRIDEFKTKMKESQAAIKNTTKDGYSFGQMIEIAAKKIAIWAISTGIIYGTLRQIEKGIQYVVELDNAMNEVRIVTGMTKGEVDDLAKSYNILAKEMGVTTKEIAKTSAELFRQGLAGKDVEERMKAIIKYAKISGISLDESNTIITATANATERSVDDIINIFALLGDTTAANASEIGEALQRVASTADALGVSVEQASAYIATISSVTRESASTIGRSLNSILSRYSQIRSKGFNDEDATQINDVTKAFHDLGRGLEAVDANGQLKPFVQLMDELGAIYPDLTKKEQNYLTTVLAGTYQRNRLNTLLLNYTDSIKNYELALNSAGVADQKFAIYQQSVQAALDKATASWEGFWQASINSDAVKWIVTAFSDIMNVATDLGGIIPILTGALSGLATYGIIQLIKYIPILITSIQALIAEGITLNTVMGGLPIIIGLVVTGITALGYAAANAKDELKETAEESKKLVDSYNQAQDAAEKSQDAQIGELTVARELTKTLFDLSDKVNKTATDKERMAGIVEQLNDILPDLNLQFEKEAAVLNLTEEAIYKNIEALKAYFITLAKREQAVQAGRDLLSLEPQRDDVKLKLDAKQKEVDALKAKIDARLAEGGGGGISTADKLDDLMKLKDELASLQKQYDDLTNSIDNANTKIKDFADAQPTPKPTTSPDSGGTYTPPLTQEAANTEISNQLSLINQLSSAYEKLAQGESLSSDEVAELISKYPILRDYLAQTGDLTFQNGRILEQATDSAKSSFREYLEGVIQNTTATAGMKAQAEALLKTLDKFDDKPAETFDEFNDKIEDTISGLDDLNSAYESISEGQELSTKTVLDLISKYPMLADYIARTGDVTFKNGQLIKQVAEIERQAMINRIKNKISETNSLIANHRAQLNSYMALMKAAIALGNMQQVAKIGGDVTSVSNSLAQAERELKSLEAQLKALMSYRPSGMSSSSGGSSAQEKEIDHAKARLKLENEIMDAVVARYEKELELAEQTYEAKKKFLEDERDKIKDLKDAYNEAYEAEEKRDELNELYRKRQNLMMGGQYGSAEYVSIDEQIKDMEKSLERDAVNKNFDDQIDAFDNLIDAEDKAFEEIRTHYDELLKDTKKLWDEVAEIMKKGTKGIIDFLKANLPGYKEASPTGQQEMVNEWTELIKDSQVVGIVSSIAATLKRGSKGNDVKKLQQVLNKLGFNAGSVDGIFGPKTQAALQAFQKKNGISQTGVLDAATKAKFKAKGYDQGGLVDYTGYAVVHGSKRKPESFLNPFDTKVIGNLMNRFELPKVLTNLARNQNAGNVDVKVIFENSKFDTPESARKTMRMVEDTMNKIFNDKNRRFGLQNNVITVRP
jgi:TP901 family phage tail tape measure protein